MKTRNAKGEINILKFLKSVTHSVLSVNKNPRTSKNGLLYDVQLKIMREDWCENNWKYENIEKNAKSFAGMPILCAYIKDDITGQYKIGDNHNFNKTKNKEGILQIDTRSDDSERIVGKINDNENEIVVKEEKGKKWIYANGVLFAWYHPQLVEQIKQLGTMDISAETLIDSETKIIDEETKGEIYPDWIATGVTILGADVPPAMPEANIKLIMMSQIKERLQAIEMGNINKHGSENNKKGETSQVKEGIKLTDFQNVFPKSRLLYLSENKDNIVMMKDGKFMSYKLDKDALSKEDFDIKSMSIDESNFTQLEAVEKSKKVVKTMSIKVDNADIETDVEDEDFKCEECEKKQEKINTLESENTKLQTEIEEKNTKITEYEKEKLNNKILEAVTKEQSIKEYEGIETEKKVPEDKMQALLADIKSGKYNSEEEAVKDYKVLFADAMEAYNNANKNHNQESRANSMGGITNPFGNDGQVKDPIAYAKERYGDNK